MTHQDDRIAEKKVRGLPTNSQFTHAISHPNWPRSFCSCGAIACRLPTVRAKKMWNMDRIGSVIHAREVMVGWSQEKASIHSGWSLKFVDMMLISEMEINALHACVKKLGLVALSVPPTHDATSAVPLQQNALQQGGGVAAQQNSQPIISPPVVQVHLQPVLLPPDQPIPPQAVLPFLTTTSVVQPVVAVEQHSLASATVRNVAETQQLATGEDSAAAEEHSSSDNHQPKEEEDSDADDN